MVTENKKMYSLSEEEFLDGLRAYCVSKNVVLTWYQQQTLVSIYRMMTTNATQEEWGYGLRYTIMVLSDCTQVPIRTLSLFLNVYEEASILIRAGWKNGKIQRSKPQFIGFTDEFIQFVEAFRNEESKEKEVEALRNEESKEKEKEELYMVEKGFLNSGYKSYYRFFNHYFRDDEFLVLNNLVDDRDKSRMECYEQLQLGAEVATDEYLSEDWRELADKVLALTDEDWGELVQFLPWDDVSLAPSDCLAEEIDEIEEIEDEPEIIN